jgi:hypothetical protein
MGPRAGAAAVPAASSMASVASNGASRQSRQRTPTPGQGVLLSTLKGGARANGASVDMERTGLMSGEDGWRPRGAVSQPAPPGAAKYRPPENEGL